MKTIHIFWPAILLAATGLVSCQPLSDFSAFTQECQYIHSKAAVFLKKTKTAVTLDVKPLLQGEPLTLKKLLSEGEPDLKANVLKKITEDIAKTPAEKATGNALKALLGMYDDNSRKKFVEMLYDKFEDVQLDTTIRYRRFSSIASALLPENAMGRFQRDCEHKMSGNMRITNGFMDFSTIFKDVPMHESPLELNEKKADQMNAQAREFWIKAQEDFAEGGKYGATAGVSEKFQNDILPRINALTVPYLLFPVYYAFKLHLDAFSDWKEIQILKNAKMVEQYSPENMDGPEPGKRWVDDRSKTFASPEKIEARNGEEWTEATSKNHPSPILLTLKEFLWVLSQRMTSNPSIDFRVMRKFGIQPDWAKGCGDFKMTAGDGSQKDINKGEKELLDKCFELAKKGLDSKDTEEVAKIQEAALGFIEPFISKLVCVLRKAGIPAARSFITKKECEDLTKDVTFTPLEIEVSTKAAQSCSILNSHLYRLITQVGMNEQEADLVAKKKSKQAMPSNQDDMVNSFVVLNPQGLVYEYIDRVDPYDPLFYLYEIQQFKEEFNKYVTPSTEYWGKLYPNGFKQFHLSSWRSYSTTKPEDFKKLMGANFNYGYVHLKNAIWALGIFVAEQLPALIPCEGPKFEERMKAFYNSHQGDVVAYYNTNYKSGNDPVVSGFVKNFWKGYLNPGIADNIPSEYPKGGPKSTKHCLVNKNYIVNFKIEHPLEIKEQMTLSLNDYCGQYFADMKAVEGKPWFAKARAKRPLPSIRAIARQQTGVDAKGKPVYAEESSHESVLSLDSIKVTFEGKEQTLLSLVESKCCTPPPATPLNKPDGTPFPNPPTWVNEIKTLWRFEFKYEDVFYNANDVSGKMAYGKGEPIDDPDNPSHTMTCTDFWTGKYTQEYFWIDALASGAPFEKRPLEGTDVITIDKDAQEFTVQSLAVQLPIFEMEDSSGLHFQSSFNGKPLLDPVFKFDDSTEIKISEDPARCPSFVKKMGTIAKLGRWAANQAFSQYRPSAVTAEVLAETKKMSDVVTSGKTEDKYNVNIPIINVKIPLSGYWSNVKSVQTFTRQDAKAAKEQRDNDAKGWARRLNENIV